MTIPIYIGSDPVIKVYVGASEAEAIYVGEDKVWPLGGSYTGPLDIVPGAVIAYGQRALSAAKLGTALYTIRRDSDDTTQSFNSDAVTGDAPVASISSFIGAGNGFVSVWDDQSGNAFNETQNELNKQPSWQENSANAHPGVIVNNSTGMFSSDTGFSGGAFSYVAGIGVTDVTTGGNFVACFDNSVNLMFVLGYYWNNPGDIYVEITSSYGGETVWVTTGTIANGNHVIDCVIDDTGAVSIFVDGVDMVATLDSGIQAPLLGPIGSATFQLPVQGEINLLLDGLCYFSALSAPNRLAIRQNIATYYGITLP